MGCRGRHLWYAGVAGVKFASAFMIANEALLLSRCKIAFGDDVYRDHQGNRQGLGQACRIQTVPRNGKRPAVYSARREFWLRRRDSNPRPGD